MIPIHSLTATRLTDAAHGSLFMPRDQGRERFLVVMLSNQYRMAVTLDGGPIASGGNKEAQQFYMADLSLWTGRRGFVVSDYEIMVDPTSSAAFRGEEPDAAALGSLVLQKQNVGILAHTRHNSIHTAAIQGEQIEDGEMDATMFSRWSIITKGMPGERHELFRHGSGVAGWLSALAS